MSTARAVLRGVKRLEVVWPEALVFAFTLVVLFDGLKLFLHSRAPWIGFGVVLILGVSVWFRLRPRNHSVWSVAGIVLVVSIVAVGIWSGQHVYDLAQAAKLAVLLGAGAGLFVSYPRYAKVAFCAVVVAVLVNGVLVLGGLLGLRNLAWEMATGRWGTILNPPGTLARLGVAIWLYAGYMALIERRWWGWGLLLLCWGLVFLEGSRTQFALAILAGLALVGVTWLESGRARLGPVILATALLLGTTVSLVWVPRPEVGLGLTAAASDPVRLEMLKAALRAIAAHPLLGTGMGTTRVETPGGHMVIHNAYLQAWADIGLFGFLSYAWLMLGWVGWSKRWWSALRGVTNLRDRALGYNAVAMLVAAAFAGMFHPLSTEWAEWILFLVPYGLFWEAVRSRAAQGG